jgi:hypothetical protein
MCSSFCALRIDKNGVLKGVLGVVLVLELQSLELVRHHKFHS